jgi:hypothetical protein
VIERIIIAVLTAITSKLLNAGLARLHSKQIAAGDARDVDEKLEQFKAAYRKAFDGKPITPDQKKELNRAISDFIRGNRL